jgi:hypothetical protein
VTGAGRLGARCIIHAVGPLLRRRPRRGRPPSLLLQRRGRGSYREQVRDRGSRPANSTGAYGYPARGGSRRCGARGRAALRGQDTVREARFWLFDQRAYHAFRSRSNASSSRRAGSSNDTAFRCRRSGHPRSCHAYAASSSPVLPSSCRRDVSILTRLSKVGFAEPPRDISGRCAESRTPAKGRFARVPTSFVDTEIADPPYARP